MILIRRTKEARKIDKKSIYYEHFGRFENAMFSNLKPL